jgi:CheY-like chemotaxis protein
MLRGVLKGGLMPAECQIVLVVDDFDEARRMLAEYLETAAGFSVETAADGREAIELAQRVRPGVVVMDLAMPVMDGVTAIKELKANSETRDIPVVVLTAFRSEDDLPQRALAAGCAEVLTKPVDLQLLERRLRHYCAPAALPESPPPV